MARVPPALLEIVQERAQGRCEYCKLPGALGKPRHQPDHIISLKHGGETELSNLAFACAHCNRYKGPNLSGRDPMTGNVTALFNPRMQEWSDHFEWAGSLLRGRTVTGPATLPAAQ